MDQNNNQQNMNYNNDQNQTQQQNYQEMQSMNPNHIPLTNNLNNNIMGLNNGGQAQSLQNGMVSEYFPNGMNQMQASEYMNQQQQQQNNNIHQSNGMELNNMNSNQIHQQQQMMQQQQSQQQSYQYVQNPIFINQQQQYMGQNMMQQQGGMPLLSNKENGGAHMQQYNDKNYQNISAQQKEEMHKRRRARNDPNNRDYQCPCGKSYLSYPALYTHIKQKHEGKAPGPVKRPNNQNSKRGRPIGKTTLLKDKDEEDFENQSTASNEALEVIEQLQLFIHEELGTSALIIDNKSHSNEELMDIFPKERFFGEDKDYYEDIYNYFCDILEKEGEIEEEINSEKLYATCINQILAIFLYKTSKHLQKDIIRELAFYVCMFRRALNNLNKINNKSSQQSVDGVEENKENENKNNDQQPKKNQYCAEHGGENVLDYSNDFIMKELPLQLQKFKDQIDTFQLIKEEFRLSRIIKITKYFCNWLFYKKYTDSQLQINENEDDDNLNNGFDEDEDEEQQQLNQQQDNLVQQ